MNPADLLGELNRLGVVVTLSATDFTRLDVGGPDTALTPDLLGRIKAHKDALLASVACQYADALLDLLTVRDPVRAADLRHEHEERLAIVEADADCRQLAAPVALDWLRRSIANDMNRKRLDEQSSN